MESKKPLALWKAFLIAALGTIVANLIILFVGKPFVGLTGPFSPLSIPPIVAWSVMGTVGATIVYVLTKKYSQKVYITISVVVLLLSFIPDILVHGMTSGPFAGGTWPAVLLLMLMHIVSAIIIVSTLLKNHSELAVNESHG